MGSISSHIMPLVIIASGADIGTDRQTDTHTHTDTQTHTHTHTHTHTNDLHRINIKKLDTRRPVAGTRLV